MMLMFYPRQTCQWEEADHLECLSIPSHVLLTYYRLAHRDMYKWVRPTHDWCKNRCVPATYHIIASSVNAWNSKRWNFGNIESQDSRNAFWLHLDITLTLKMSILDMHSSDVFDTKYGSNHLSKTTDKWAALKQHTIWDSSKRALRKMPRWPVQLDIWRSWCASTDQKKPSDSELGVSTLLLFPKTSLRH